MNDDPRPAPNRIAPPPARRGWPGYAKASVAWHAGCGGLALAAPEVWPLALAGVAVNHAALTAGGLWPRAQWLGRNWTRLPAPSAARREFAITIDDGPDPEVTPAVLDLLDAHGARATFFVIGRRAEAAPALTAEIVRRGHGIANHSDRHGHRFSLLGPRAMRQEIAAAQERIAAVAGERPRHFRAPAGLRNPFLPPILESLGLEYVSWTRRGFDTVDRDAGKVVLRLVRGLAAGDILLLHDGHAARGAGDRPVVLDALPAVLTAARAAGLRAVPLDAAFSPRPIGDAAGAARADAPQRERRI